MEYKVNRSAVVAFFLLLSSLLNSACAGGGNGGNIPVALFYASGEIQGTGSGPGATPNVRIPVTLENRYELANLSNPRHTFPIAYGFDYLYLLNDPAYNRSLSNFNSLPGVWHITEDPTVGVPVAARYGFIFGGQGRIPGEPENYLVRVTAQRSRAGGATDTIVRYIDFFSSEIPGCALEEAGDSFFTSMGSCGSPGRYGYSGATPPQGGFIYDCDWQLEADLDPVADPTVSLSIGAQFLVKQGPGCGGTIAVGATSRTIRFDPALTYN